MRQLAAQLAAASRLAVAQVRQHPRRFGFAIIGVTLAVLAITLLAGTGVGVVDTGSEQFEQADRDLWVSSGETQLTPARGGGFDNTIHDSRALAEEINAHDGVANAVPIAFETVYVSPERDGDYETYIGTGIPGGGESISVTEGEQLRGDPYYADGEYDGNRTREVLLDRETASALNVSVGDTIFVGGSLASAQDNEVTVIGISPTFEQMLGTPTVTMPLSELHETTGTTFIEPATFIMVTVEEDAAISAVQADLQEAYPEYAIRTNQEQLEAVLDRQVLVIAAGSTLIVLAVGAGIALTFNVLALVVYQQRREFGALHAQGVSGRVLVGSVFVQGVIIGLVGGSIGAILTWPAVRALNRIAATLVGFEGLVQTMPIIYAGGFVVAVIIGTLSALATGWRLYRTPTIDQLR